MTKWYECYSQEIEQIILYASLGYNRHLTVASSGNVSLRCDKGFLITATGVTLRDIKPEQILLVSADGAVIAGDPCLQPSKELGLHLTFYNAYPWINSVYHVHPPYITAYLSANKPFPRITSAAKNKLPPSNMVAAAPAGSSLLIENLQKTMASAESQPKLFTVEAHGIFTLGSTLADCYAVAELAEDCAKIGYYRQNILKNTI